MTDLPTASTAFTTFVYTPVEGIYAANSVIRLDGKWFSGCTFTDCILVFEGREPFGMAGSQFPGCKLQFAGVAQMVLDRVGRLVPDLIAEEDLRTTLLTLASAGVDLQ